MQVTIHELKKAVVGSDMDQRYKLEVIRNLNILNRTHSGGHEFRVIVDMTQDEYKYFNRKREILDEVKSIPEANLKSDIFDYMGWSIVDEEDVEKYNDLSSSQKRDLITDILTLKMHTR